ncbi:DUF2513 domain-containing protein [Variovorax sp. J2P1-59]|uniref:DUF2513 domain-containing protein n=1 Tax=Variovorax flavidus TaxID=3053501 RepID=UPI002574DA61|nr:DUF2513 domain-containing protein [Variovorax sp. J2P1-59]MDM0073984.1 DUF2513 domain-containing protein [Variovorax sp. J2P1-59]
MKLDWDIVRDVMTEIEDMTATERNAAQFRARFDDDGADATRARHVLLLRDAGLVSGVPYQDFENAGLMNPELTWEGHQLLATIRSKDVWERVKSIAKTKGLALSFDLVKIGGKLALEHVLKGITGDDAGNQQSRNQAMAG